MTILDKISNILPGGVFSVEFDDLIKKADDIMKKEKIKRVPVVENGKFIGVITERTLMEYSLRRIYDSGEEFGEIGYNKISDFQNILARDVFFVYPEDSVNKAMEIMTKKHIDYVVVVDWEKNLVGILTAIDVLMYLKSQID